MNPTINPLDPHVEGEHVGAAGRPLQGVASRHEENVVRLTVSHP